jgi:hypothetical protein
VEARLGRESFADLLAGALDEGEVEAAVMIARGADADEREVRVKDGFGRVGGSAK